MSGPNEIDLNIVVNGRPEVVKANVNSPLHTAIQHALQASGNSGQPFENWELRDAGGQVLDPTRKISDFNFPEKVTLFLSLKAGVGG